MTAQLRSRLGVAELRMLPAALGGWAAGGVLVGVAPGGEQVAASVVLWVAAAAAALGARWMRALGWVGLALSAAALVATVVAVQAPDRTPAAFATAARGTPVELLVVPSRQEDEGRVPGRARLQGAPAAGEASVLLFLDGTRMPIEPGIGETWTVTATLRAVAPGDEVSYLAFARGAPVRIAEAPPALAAASELRAGLREVSTRLPGEGGRLLPGLAVGDTSRVDASLDLAMKTSSLSHLTAVSGANCAVIVAAVFALCAFAGLQRGIRVAVSLAALVGFVVLVTPQPSVLRAAVMGGIVLSALALGRPARGFPALCLAVIALLVADPWLARSYGFALSALATAGLLLLASPLARALERWMPSALALVVAVPIAAQLACQPVLLMLSPALPLWGVPANLLAAPAAPVATVIGLIACLVAPVAPPLAASLAAIAWLPASWIAAVAAFFASLPGARMPWPAGPFGIAAFVALAVLLLVAVLGPPGARWRRIAAGLVLVALLGYAGALVGIRVVQLAGRPADWQYAMCDVGQGDASLIRSNDAVVLVDTGPEPERLARCLDDLGIGRIDLLVLTHYDLDHVGGTDAVLGRVGTAIVGPVGEPDDERLRAQLQAGGARVVEGTDGMTGRIGALSWRAVWPPPHGLEPGNAASVALLVEPGSCAGCLSGLFTGDLGEESQNRMLGAERLPHVDVLKVAHHGSADFSATLYAQLAATVGLIGVGADNDYGHPTARALDALAASGTAVFRTDLDGLILVAPPTAPGDPPRIWTER